MITVNEVELADEIASAMMDLKYAGDPWMEKDSEKSEHSLVVKEGQCREDYDRFYDEALTLIQSCTEK